MNLTSSLIKNAGLKSSFTRSSTGQLSIDDESNKLPKSTDASFSRDDILSHSLALTDLIFGVYAVELWRYDEDNGKLVNVSLTNNDIETGSSGCGMCIKRKTQEADPSNRYYTQQAVDAHRRLTDPLHSGFLPAAATEVGVGLAGVLWAETASSKGINHGRQMVNNHSRRHLTHGGHGNESVSWRSLEELANDPDQPFDERLQLFAIAGFKLATGIPFDSNGYRGIVIFFGNPHASDDKLNSPTNASFMHTSAQMLGSSVAIQAQICDIKAFRDKIRHDNWHITKVKVTSIIRFGGSLRKEAAAHCADIKQENTKDKRRAYSIQKIRDVSICLRTNAKEIATEAKDNAKVKLSRYLKKIQGGSAGIPPSFTNSQTLLTFIGVFITHLILSRLDLFIKIESNNELGLILPPLGALSTLQYSLTAAPASQPRNALFAQIFSVTVAILLCYIPNIEPWFRSALAPALVIPCMARFGIIHPPAGAAAIVFASGKFGWEHVGIFIGGVCISISTAVMVNNWSDKRQYPTSWYLIRKAKVSCAKE